MPLNLEVTYGPFHPTSVTSYTHVQQAGSQFSEVENFCLQKLARDSHILKLASFAYYLISTWALITTNGYPAQASFTW